MDLATLGHWAFIIGVIIAILAAFAGTSYTNTVVMLLVTLGVIVGLLNISEKEVYNFLIAAIALMMTGAAGLSALPVLGSYLGPIVQNIATFVAPAAVIVALKAVYDLGKK